MNTKMFEDMMREGMTFEEIIEAAKAADAKIAEEKSKEAAAKEKTTHMENLDYVRAGLADALVSYMEVLMNEEFSDAEFEEYVNETIKELVKEEKTWAAMEELVKKYAKNSKFDEALDKFDKIFTSFLH